MIIFSQAKSILREAKRKRCDAQLLQDRGFDIDPESVYNNVIESRKNEFQQIIDLAHNLHELYGKTMSRLYWITIRPKPGVSWVDFFSAIKSLCERKCFVEYRLSFEQKCPEGTGSGFHIHMLASMTQRSKGEVLRDLKSSLNDICDNPGIDVRSRASADTFEKYCVNYESKDGHKLLTKVGDEVWRKSLGLLNEYNRGDPWFMLSTKSEGTAKHFVSFA